MLTIVEANGSETKTHTFNDDTTIASIIYAIEYIKKERERHRARNAKRNRPSTGRPVGRPKKSPPAPEIPPA